MMNLWLVVFMKRISKRYGSKVEVAQSDNVQRDISRDVGYWGYVFDQFKHACQIVVVFFLGKLLMKI